eukprot:scaffold135114_cov102-Phaeocystis_antarctica.AAC.1
MSVAEPLAQPEAAGAHVGAHDAHGFTIRSPLPSASAAHRTRGPQPQPQSCGVQPSAASRPPATPGRAPGAPGRAPGTPGVPR